MLTFLKKIFTWWNRDTFGTRIQTILFGKFVGKDNFGNKYYEDRKNIKRDIRKGNVRAIIVIEDTPRYYSNLLPMIYKEIVYHTKQLIDKSLNNTHRLLHMRARPKILLAQNYEEAEKYFKRYGMNILGIISDIRFPKNKKMTTNAGIQFAKFVRSI